MSPAYLHLLPVFLAEARTCLEALEAALDVLELDLDSRSAWQSAARAAHTLKGNAAMMELHDVSDAAFAAELLAESGHVAPVKGTLDMLVSCEDTLRQLVADVAAGESVPPADLTLVN